MVGNFLWTLGTLLSPFKGVFIIDPDGPRKENEDYKTRKQVIKEHEEAEFIPYHYKLKGYEVSIIKVRKIALKEAKKDIMIIYHHFML